MYEVIRVPLLGAHVHVTASAISLNVTNVETSASFLVDHFGFTRDMGADGFASLSHQDAGFNVIYLRTGLSTFKPAELAGRHADGVLIVFVVDDVDAQYARIRAEGVTITTPIETEPWGERFFQVTDPNGVVIQLVQWMTATDDAHAEASDGTWATPPGAMAG